MKGFAKDAHDDGRITAVSNTENPGGNPHWPPMLWDMKCWNKAWMSSSISPAETLTGGMVSRALQLAHMGMKNILALTGDYSGTGFGIWGR